VQAFVAVRARALQRLETALADVESKGGNVLDRVQELSVAERDAARALGVDWRRFTWVRDQIGRLLTTQRQQEDQRLLEAELTRSKDDLTAQLEAARDGATRQFLEAQLKALSAQLEKLERDRQLPAPQVQEMQVLESARAEIATLQGRQDRIQHRLQELLQKAAAGSAPTPPARVPAR
jgi:chromosome segregation ATPase